MKNKKKPNLNKQTPWWSSIVAKCLESLEKTYCVISFLFFEESSSDTSNLLFIISYFSQLYINNFPAFVAILRYLPSGLYKIYVGVNDAVEPGILFSFLKI